MPSDTCQPTPTEALEVFWDFAAERQGVYHDRVAGIPGPWTDDPILAQHRFTNAYRAADRVSQYLINEVIYHADAPTGWRDTVARILTFKIFNRIDTWEAAVAALGRIDAAAVIGGDVANALDCHAARHPVYNAAYIMPPPRTYDGPKYRRHLNLIADMLLDDVDERTAEATSLAQVYGILHGYPSIGPFLAYQFTIDLNYSPQLRFDENDFVVAGPGALRGLAKCFADAAEHSPSDLIRWTAERQHEALTRRERWQDLWGRPLHLIDVQNLFCEIDKYTRVARPDLCRDIRGNRIKQRYHTDPTPITAAFPPKWDLIPPETTATAGTNRQLQFS